MIRSGGETCSLRKGGIAGAQTLKYTQSKQRERKKTYVTCLFAAWKGESFRENKEIAGRFIPNWYFGSEKEERGPNHPKESVNVVGLLQKERPKNRRQTRTTTRKGALGESEKRESEKWSAEKEGEVSALLRGFKGRKVGIV